MYIEMKIDKLPFTYKDERIDAEMSARLESIDDMNAIDGQWFVHTYDGYLTIRGGLAKPALVTFELGHAPSAIFNFE